jgi:cytochrome P450
VAGRGQDPVELTASAAAPDAALADLRRCPVGRQPSGRWAVTDPAVVAAVLTSDEVVVAPPGPVATEVDRVRAIMARFSDGGIHRRRRAIAVDVLAGLEPGRLRQRALEVTDASLEARLVADVTGLARRVPVRVLAAAMGWHDPGVDAAVATLCARLAPRLDDPDRPGDATVSAHLRDAVGDLDERTVNELGVLFQARDATAALVAVAATRLLDGTVREFTVADVLAADRAEPVLHTTTRRTAAELDLGGVTVPAGETIVVALGAATRVAADGTMSFGTGAHACPGRDLALAIAAGMLTALGRRGARVAAPDRYEPRPNLRVPVLGPAKLTAHRCATSGDGP